MAKTRVKCNSGWCPNSKGVILDKENKTIVGKLLLPEYYVDPELSGSPRIAILAIHCTACDGHIVMELDETSLEHVLADNAVEAGVIGASEKTQLGGWTKQEVIDTMNYLRLGDPKVLPSQIIGGASS